jgi:hypothetical protein
VNNFHISPGPLFIKLVEKKNLLFEDIRRQNDFLSSPSFVLSPFLSSPSRHLLLLHGLQAVRLQTLFVLSPVEI